MQQLHNCLSHDGIKEQIRRISAHYYWDKMKSEITQYVQSCHGCQSAKPSRQKNAHAGQFDVPDSRFLHCHVDIVGPLPVSEGFRYL